jgi:hypothetical protein
VGTARNHRDQPYTEYTEESIYITIVVVAAEQKAMYIVYNMA